MLRVEAKRALNNRMFYLTILVGVAALWPGLQEYLDGYWLGWAFGPFYYNRYEAWIWAYFHGLLPVFAALLVALPAASSYLQDKQTGYRTFVLMRGEKIRYLWAKIISNFVAGGLVMLIPLLLLFVVTSIMLPAGLPERLRILDVGAFSHLYRPAPVLYILILSGVGFLFGGVYATLALSLSALTSSQYLVTAAPFVLFWAANFVLSIPGLARWAPPQVLGPLSVTSTSWVTVLTGLAVPAGISLLLFIYLWRKELRNAS